MKLSDVKQGDVLIADGGFTCLKEGQRCAVQSDSNGLFIPCNEGKHYLDGQVSFDNKGELVGLTK